MTDLRRAVLESYRVSHFLAQIGAHFVGNTFRY